MADAIGRYRTERRLGSGAFATVWLGYDEALDARVAIKVLAENWAHDDDIRRRFTEEARILWRLDSDHIVRVHTVDTLEDGRPYFVMDYADRGSLADRMRDRKQSGRPYSIAEALDVAIEIADGLAVAHGLGVVHRDLKPSNILYRSVAQHTGDARMERMVIADFGIARSLEGTVATTIAAGTPHYMAPEQTEGRADRRSDVYAAAVVLYELLAGTLPYPGESVGQVLRAQLTTKPAPIAATRGDLPPELDAVIAHGLATDPDARLASATEWGEALRAIRRGVATPAVGETVVPVRRDETATNLAASGATGTNLADAGATGTNLADAGATGADVPDADATHTGVAAAGAAAGVAAGAAAAAGAGPAGSGPLPPGPPIPSGPPPSVPRGPGPQADRRRRRRVLAAVAIVALVAIVAGIAVVTTGGSKSASAAEIFREARTTIGRNPFTQSIQVPNFTVPASIPNPPGAPEFPPKGTGGQIQSIDGSTVGLYGGTQQLSSCDANQMVQFLQQNLDKAAAWAGVEGITVDQIPSYVAGLTSVVLRGDTRVTNHGFANGRASELQSILQAGTAVLVDRFGVPRAKCFCGNPLLAPQAVSSPQYTGPAWPGFSPTKVTVIVPAATPVAAFVLVDVTTGKVFARPVGTNGSKDAPTTLPPVGGGAGGSTTTSPRTTTPTTVAKQVVDATREGQVSASSVFGGNQFPPSLAVDGDAATSWFSGGSNADGDTSTFTWQGARDDTITTVTVVGNGQNSNPSFRTGFGFNNITVLVLDSGGRTVFNQTIGFPSGANGNTVSVQPGVVGRSVVLRLNGHESAVCGGIGELQVKVAR